MKYSEINLTIVLKEDVHFLQSGTKVGKILHNLMLNDAGLMILHSKKSVKNYVFSNFYPTEKDGIYKAGKPYVFKIRSFDLSVASAFKKVIDEKSDNYLFNVLASEIKTVNRFHIAAFTSVTPVIVTYKKGNFDRCWTMEDDLFALHGQLQKNLMKKYEIMTGEKIETDESFIQLFTILNKKPLKVVYEHRDKGGRVFLGNKFKIVPNDDDNSQKLAFTALACGLGEKNSLLGGGFCLGEGIRI